MTAEEDVPRCYGCDGIRIVEVIGSQQGTTLGNGLHANESAGKRPHKVNETTILMYKLIKKTELSNWVQ